MLKTDRIYFVPGIMGSTLIKPGDPDSTVWSLDYANLVDTLTSDPESLEGDLEPGEVILYAKPPWMPFKLISVYARLMSFLEEYCPPARVVAFPYDWRKANHLSAYRLAERILADSASSADGRIFIVTHSMGGLVALLAAQILNSFRPGAYAKIAKIYRRSTSPRKSAIGRGSRPPSRDSSLSATSSSTI